MEMGSGGSCFDSNFCGEINDLLLHSVPVLPCSFTLHYITAFRFHIIITNYQLKTTTILGQSYVCYFDTDILFLFEILTICQ